jgi:arylformamidase
MFSIDLTKYRVVDLSLEVVVPGTEERPFRATRGHLADRAFKHDIETHTHVGAHIESPAHFYEDGQELGAYPLSRFFGRAVLFEFSGIDGENIDGPKLEKDIGNLVQPGDFVLFRNNHPDWRRIEIEDRSRIPYLCADGCRWLAEKKVKMIVIDTATGIRVANGSESSRENHDILMRPEVDVLLLEGADGLDDLTQKEFFFMALPFKTKGIDSAWTRAIAIEEINE